MNFPVADFSLKQTSSFLRMAEYSAYIITFGERRIGIANLLFSSIVRLCHKTFEVYKTKERNLEI